MAVSALVRISTHSSRVLVNRISLIAELTSHSLALLMEVSLPGSDVVFSDNYFNLPADRMVRISCPMPSGWTLDRAKTEFHIRSVYDSYSHGTEI